MTFRRGNKTSLVKRLWYFHTKTKTTNCLPPTKTWPKRLGNTQHKLSNPESNNRDRHQIMWDPKKIHPTSTSKTYIWVMMKLYLAWKKLVVPAYSIKLVSKKRSKDKVHNSIKTNYTIIRTHSVSVLGMMLPTDNQYCRYQEHQRMQRNSRRIC